MGDGGSFYTEGTSTYHATPARVIKRTGLAELTSNSHSVVSNGCSCWKTTVGESTLAANAVASSTRAGDHFPLPGPPQNRWRGNGRRLRSRRPEVGPPRCSEVPSR